MKKNDKKSIAVIGAGFFGTMTAIRLVDAGFRVTVYDMHHDIMYGASHINQNRVHMGYHYPRSDATAVDCIRYDKAFREMFPQASVGDFDHYYCVAKAGSKVTPKEYLAFCDRLGLPYERAFPIYPSLSKDLVSLSIKVPEHVYDSNALRESIYQMLTERREHIALDLKTKIKSIQKRRDKFHIRSAREGATKNHSYAGIINATYSNLNHILQLAGYDTEVYQYELCEVPIISVPWKKKTGFAVMDGQYFGILPYGLSNMHLLYDVDLSVLERMIGHVPKFKYNSAHYDDTTRSRARFKKYMKKIRPFVGDTAQYKYIQSAYVTRMVLTKREHDDARPSEILDHGGGLWSIFSGKVSMAIPLSEEIAKKVLMALK